MPTGGESSRYDGLVASDKTTIRRALPIFDEGLLFARYLKVAADGAFRVMLGSGHDRVIGEAYVSPGHDMSFENGCSPNGRVVSREWRRATRHCSMACRRTNPCVGLPGFGW
jgi:hypothetical protein